MKHRSVGDIEYRSTVERPDLGPQAVAGANRSAVVGLTAVEVIGTVLVSLSNADVAAPGEVREGVLDLVENRYSSWGSDLKRPLLLGRRSFLDAFSCPRSLFRERRSQRSDHKGTE